MSVSRVSIYREVCDRDMCVPPPGGRRAPRSKTVQEGIDAMNRRELTL